MEIPETFESEAAHRAFIDSFVAGDVTPMTDEQLEANYQQRLASGRVIRSRFEDAPDVPGARLSFEEQRELNTQLAAIDEVQRRSKASAATYYFTHGR